MADGITYFFDSYALIALYEKDAAYENVAQANAVTTYFHVLETYYSLIKKGYLEEEVEKFFSVLISVCVDMDFSWIPLAVQFRKQHTKKRLSYADCIGYVAAKQMNIPFLTGDKEFRNLPHVAFVKATA